MNRDDSEDETTNEEIELATIRKNAKTHGSGNGRSIPQLGKKWVTRFRNAATRKKQKKITLKERKKAGHYLKPVKVWLMRHLLWLLSFVPYFRDRVREAAEEERRVLANDRHFNKKSKFRGNAISTTKYSIITFLPKNLFEQFKRLANIWFLLVACIQLIPGISPLNPAASIVPLVFVLSVTAVKEAIEDIKRWISDKRINNQEVLAAVGSQFTKIAWHKVRVGDIIKIRKDQGVPADIIVLSSSDPEGLCYIETSNLDGETNLKVRQAVEDTADYLAEEDHVFDWEAEIRCEKPNPELYSFEGAISIKGQETVIPVDLEQTVWRGCTLRNTDWVVGVVIYTGMDTKVMENARKPPSKRSTLEKEMNKALLTIFVFALAVDVVGAILAGVWASVYGYDHWYIQLEDIQSSAAVLGLEAFAGWLILLNVIIPISLYVYMEMVKLVMVYWINSDIDMYHAETDTPAKANTSNLAEQLGQIEYIFSDKTGTLTSNQMYFMRCSINGKTYGAVPQQHQRAPSGDGAPIIANDGNKNATTNGETQQLPQESDVNGEEEEGEEEAYIFKDPELTRDVHEVQEVDEFFKLLAVCHTVIIEVKHDEEDDEDKLVHHGDDNEQIDEEDRNDQGSSSSTSNSGNEGEDNQEKKKKKKNKNADPEEGNNNNKDVGEGPVQYQAASPDEAALVLAAQKLGYEFFARDNSSISIRVHGREERWEQLNTLEFNSDRKRMSVIVRDPSDGRIKLYCKGADTVLFDRLAEGQQEMEDVTRQHLQDFACEGLRTLCLAYKVLEEDEYERWNKRHYEASIKINGREEALDEVAEEIERDLVLIGATAIEDKLQDGVPDAIATLLRAGIKMWVLTGDKMETAINIGFSCSLLDNDMNQMILSAESTTAVSEKDRITNPAMAIRQLERHIRRNFPEMKPLSECPEILAMLREAEREEAEDSEEDGDDSDKEDQSGSGENNGNDAKRIRLNEDDDDDDDDEDANDRRSSSMGNRHALIIDGKSLAQYLPPKGAFTPLSVRFLEMAMRCKVVICCRVTPLQKALVVKVVQLGVKANTLSIGDGANDVPMIQQADIGVGISGKEGPQAALSADYAIAQFRFLVPLLLVHGHWSYRRMSLLLLYSFYKNIVFALPNFWFGIFSGFSAQTMFDSWAVSVYNILFTGLPILMIAIFDQPTTRQQIYRFPRLYERGIKGKDFSRRMFWGWQLLGIYQGIVLSFFGFAAFWNANVSSDGLVLGLFAMGTSIFTSVILVVSVKIVLITSTWTVFNHLGLYLSLLLWFLFIIIYAFVPENAVIRPNELFWLTFNMMSTAAFWLNPLLATTLCVLPDLAYAYVRRNYYPDPYHIVQEIKKIERRARRKPRRRFMRRAFRPLLGEEKPPRRKERAPTHTGFAFSQDPGQIDVLYSKGQAPLPSPTRRKPKKGKKNGKEK